MEKKTQFKYSLLLLLTAAIWGLGFVAQSAGMDYVGPFTFNGIRNFLAAIVLIPVILVKDKIEGVTTKWTDKKLIMGGVICGVFLFLASSAQQIGIVTTSTGKSGFITALYIVLVPIASILFKKKPGKFIWISVVLAVLGLYFLCITDSLTLQTGDIWLFACAVLFTGQILAIDRFAPNLDAVKLSFYEFLTVGVLSIIPIICEKPEMHYILACWLPYLYASVFSSGVAYTLQMVSQKKVEPTVASLLMSLESVFSAIFGFIVLHQQLSVRELIGCALMFAAVILAQLTPSKEK